MHWYVRVLKKYATFSGRATRPEFWWFTLIHTIIVITCLMIDVSTGMAFLLMNDGDIVRLTGTLTEQLQSGQVVQIVGVVMMIYLLLVMIPQLAVSIRRLHDSGKSAWWMLLSIIPFGIIVLAVLFALPSDKQNNKYDNNPDSPQQDSVMM